MRVTFHINTKDRPEHLAIALTALWSQTFQDWDLIVLDRGEPMAIEREGVRQMVGLIERFGHSVTYQRPDVDGIPQTYQRMMEMSKTPLCYRSEDDMALEPECLQRLCDEIVKDENIAVAAPLTPDWKGGRVLAAPSSLRNGFQKAHNADSAPSQGFIYEACDEQSSVYRNTNGVYDVCVVHAGGLYRKDAAMKVGGFAKHFSPTGHREESWFYTKLYVEGGYRLIVVPTARSWHFQASFGGSRPRGVQDSKRIENRRTDEAKFQADFLRWQKMAIEKKRPLKMLDE